MFVRVPAVTSQCHMALGLSNDIVITLLKALQKRVTLDEEL
jgi:hypothetical protein